MKVGVLLIIVGGIIGIMPAFLPEPVINGATVLGCALIIVGGVRVVARSGAGR